MYQQPEITLTKINPRKRSNTWNNSSSKKFFESLPTNRQVKTSCLFCQNPVFIEKNATDSNVEIMVRNLTLKNLCLHTNISSNIIPDECSRSMFPFCCVCEGLLNQLWECQEILDKVWLKISNVVSAIEKAVADGELCSANTSVMADLNKQKFTQLRDMILEGYRQKLEMKDGLVIPCNSAAEMAPTNNIEIGDTNNTTQTLSPISGESLEKVNIISTVDKQEEQQCEPPAQKILIADLIKQEINETKGGIKFGGKGSKKKEPDSDIYEVKPRKRRLLFEEVEVYKCVSLKPRVEYLQCSLCSYTLAIPKKAPKGHTTSYNKMKTHILLAHKNGQTESKHDCSQEFSVECDVCFRPIKKGNTLNLNLHKTCHKNAAETKTVLAAGTKRRGRPKKKDSTVATIEKTQARSERDDQVQPICCPVCKRSFSSIGCLATHIARLHNGSSTNGWPALTTLESESKLQRGDITEVSPVHKKPIVIEYPAKPNKGCIEDASLREILARCFGPSNTDDGNDIPISKSWGVN